MNNDKYVAMDVHKASVVIGMRDAAGKMIGRAVVETKAQTLKDYVRGLSGTIHLTFEEGTQSAWLYDLLKPLVADCIVCDPRRNKLLESGNKSDEIDVEKLSELLYLGRLQAVYHGDHGTRTLKELAHNYESLVKDNTRIKNRLKAIFRGRGIGYEGGEIYDCTQQEAWLGKLSERGVRERARQLCEQLAQLEGWVANARLQMLRESRKQKAKKILEQIPTLGEISVAQLIATVDTPFRFRSKRQFWTYCGLAVVRHTSADYRFEQGELRRRAKPGPTRGLNRNYNRRLKRLFKSAALSGSVKGPFKPYYQRLLARGLNPELAQVTLARKIAAVTLMLWKKGASFDRQKLIKPE
ncbi:MAG: transposase [Pyrinomonadaceae bacterium]